MAYQKDAREEDELKSLQCHFNWNILTDDSNDDYFFEDRLATLDGHISDGDIRNLPQIYTTKAYFMAMYTKLDTKQ